MDVMHVVNADERVVCATSGAAVLTLHIAKILLLLKELYVRPYSRAVFFL